LPPFIQKTKRYNGNKTDFKNSKRKIRGDWLKNKKSDIIAQNPKIVW